MRPHRKRATPREGRPSITLSINAAILDSTSTPPTAIVIAPEPFGIGFDVHAPDPALSREWPTLATARCYAHLIAVKHGWRIDDRTEA